MKKVFVWIVSIGMVLSGLTGCGNANRQSDTDQSQAPADTETAEPGQPAVSEASEEAGLLEEEFPDEAPVNNEWKVASPERFGVDSAVFEEIHSRIANSEMLAVVTVKDGLLVDEFYQEGYDQDSVFHMHSVTKSVMGSLIGIAIGQGILEGADAKLASFFPQAAQWDDARKQEVTVRHLLTHTSGIGRGDSESFQALVTSENWVNYYLSQPMSADPGTSFHYTTAGSHMLSAILEQAAGMSTYDYAVEHLFGPIGIESARWDTDPQGITDGGNGLHLSVRDAARFGQLYLEEGSWHGRRIVPQAWVEESLQVHSAGVSDKGEYGYQWWIREFGQDAAYSGYYALGYAGQFILVVPELGLVTAVASKSVWSSYTAQVCFDEIVAAFTA